MKTLKRKVKIGVKKYETVKSPLLAEEEKQLAEFAREIENHEAGRVRPKISVIEQYTKSYWFPENFKSIYEPL